MTKKGKAQVETVGEVKTKKGKKVERVTEFDGKPFTTDESTRIVEVIPDGKDIVVIAVSTWKGKDSLDIRKYYETEDGWAPGKGLRCSLKIVVELAAAITHVEP